MEIILRKLSHVSLLLAFVVDSFTHTHAHTHTHTQRDTHAHTHKERHTHTHTHTHKETHYTSVPGPICCVALVNQMSPDDITDLSTFRPLFTQGETCTHTRVRTHTHTHTLPPRTQLAPSWLVLSAFVCFSSHQSVWVDVPFSGPPLGTATTLSQLSPDPLCVPHRE